MIRSIEKARPSTKANATSDMKPALPSKNFFFNIWRRPPVCSPASSSAAMLTLSISCIRVESAERESAASTSELSALVVATSFWGVVPVAGCATAEGEATSKPSRSKPSATPMIHLFLFVFTFNMIIMFLKCCKFR